MALVTTTLQSTRANRVLKTFAIWLCSLSLLAPVLPTFAAATVTTTSTVAASNNPVAVGSPTILTASVTGTNPTGTVTFKRGTTTLGTGTLSGTGNTRTATYSATFTTVAANSITAVYAGDTVNKTSTSPALIVNSAKATPTNTLSANVNPSTFGASVTFTATVVGYTPSGTVIFKDGSTTLGTKTLSGTGNTRTASFATTALSVATHAITAEYAGNTLNNIATSAALNQIVNPRTSTTTLASSLNPSTSGATVTFTATVTGSTPTGTVSFMDGATTLGTGTIASGKATFATNALAVASHSITAVYAGDAKHLSSTSSAVNQVVKVKATTTALTSSLNPSTSGTEVIFTATVTGDAPTGNITFMDGTTPLGTGKFANGTATYPTSDLSVASHRITAVYSGDSNNSGSTSGRVNQVVKKRTTTTTLASSANPSVTGATITFTAAVTGSTPSGTVTFKDGTSTLGTGTITGGVATYTTSSLSIASHSITAVYAGDANNRTSTSSALSQVISNKTAATASVTSSLNPSTAGASVSFTASVTGTAPSGTVTFKDGATTLGTGTLTGTGNTRSATFATSALSIASHSITVVYAGDVSNTTATSGALSQVVTTAVSGTTLSSSANPVAFGAAITFTATVTANIPTGTVTFKDGATTLGTGTITSGVATYTTSALSTATHSITAIYSGDSNNAASTSNTVNQVVSTVTSGTTLTSSTNPAAFGIPITLTATITGNAPTGTVTFNDGATALGNATVSGGVASLTTSTLSTSDHSITAAYSGDANNAASTSNTLSQVINPVVSATTLASSANPTTFGTSVSFTATVTGSTPTGIVTFMDGATTLGTGTLAAGVATYSNSALAGGTHSITAVYAGDSNNASSTSSAVSQVVNAVASMTALSTSLSPAVAGTAVTFTATVTGNTPSGTVSFNDGATPIGTGTVTNGLATFTTSALAVGSHSMTAVYAGDGNNASSTSSAVSQDINPAVATTTTLESSAGSAALGSTITFTASITGNAPTGTVTFNDGATTLGTGTLEAGVASLATSTLGLGAHSITAIYGGDSVNTGSTSAVFNQTITAALVGNPMTWQYGYDAMGRPTITTDPYGKAAYTYYDALGRPIQTQEAVGSEQSIIQYAYNAADGLTKVTDPRTLETTYNPNGLGNVTSQTSPDTGTASSTFDANGNQLSKTDARGKVTTYSYDNLNRLTTTHYQSGTDTILEYDGGATPTPATAGELTKVTDESGQTNYAYDSAGRLVTKTQIANGKTFTVSYTWGDSGSSLDKLTAITYPSGSRVNYAYDAQGGVSAITVNAVNANGVGASGTNSPLLSGITLSAAGEVTGWNWASGKTQTRTYDQYGQPSSYKLGDATGSGASAGTTRTITYDGAGRIMAYGHTNNGTPQASLNQTFAYDDLTRLVGASMGSSAIQYSYDLNGNRTSKVISGTAYNNTVSPTSNKLMQTQDVGGTAAIEYDAMGNVTNDGINSYNYSDRGRLSSVITAGGTVNYRYNGFEQRVYKTGPTALIPTGTAYYVYNEAGQLLGEYFADGTPIYETIYLNASPVGVMKQTGTAQSASIATSIYNVYSDHLATPRVITRATDEAIVWRWDTAEAFGATAPDQDPNNLGTFVFNQRLPGQTFDAETGLFQNWHREYNARLGRYIQSDPIGLRGGINTYAYVGGNPLRYVDPRGLAKSSIDAAIESAIIRGDTRALTNLIEGGGLSPAQQAAAQEGLRVIDILKNGIQRERELADILGKTKKQIEDAIHKCKNKNRTKSASERNPDTIIDPRNGEVYPKFKDGRIGDSIGNIFDYL